MVTKLTSRKTVMDSPDTYNLDLSVEMAVKTLWYMPELNIIHRNYQTNKYLSFLKLIVTNPTSRKTVLKSSETNNLDPSVQNGCKDVMVHA